MIKRKKNLLIIIILFLVITSICSWLAVSLLQSSYYNKVFLKEEMLHSYDGAYSYLQLSSPKKMICSLYIYKKELVNTEENFFSHTLVYTGIIFNDHYMNKILWGKDSYDLFFHSKEEGLFCYKYVNEEWIGGMSFDVEATGEEHRKGNTDIYCFSGDRKVESLKSEINPAGFEQISGQIKKQNIPDYFLEKFDSKLNIL